MGYTLEIEFPMHFLVYPMHFCWENKKANNIKKLKSEKKFQEEEEAALSRLTIGDQLANHFICIPKPDISNEISKDMKTQRVTHLKVPG